MDDLSRVDCYSVANSFWTSKTNYPTYENIKQRRYYEVSYILNKISFQRMNTVIDVGCGDGALVQCMDCLLEIDKINCYDISDSLMSNINNPKVSKAYFDCNDTNLYGSLPKCDLLVFGGVINFMFNDDTVIDLLKHFNARHIFIRTPCTLKPHDDLVNVYSEKLQDHYASIYRTMDKTLCLIRKSGLVVLEQLRIYPDHIESQYDTKQIMYYCTRP